MHTKPTPWSIKVAVIVVWPETRNQETAALSGTVVTLLNMNNSHGTVPSRSAVEAPISDGSTTDQRWRPTVPQPSGGAKYDSFFHISSSPTVRRQRGREKRKKASPDDHFS